MSLFSTNRKSSLYVATAAAGGAVAGWLVGQSVSWTAVGVVVGIGIAAMVVFVGIRPLVAIPVGIGAGVGAYLGSTIVGVICEPRGCPAFEATAAVTTGIGALVGIGLVVALATRSFDEYHEAVARGSQPPVTGCSNGEADGSD